MADTNYQVSTELKVVGAKAYADDFRKGAAGANELNAALGKLGKGSMGLVTGGLGAAETALKSFAAAASVAVGSSVYLGGKIAEAVGADMSGLENSANQLGAVIGAATQQGFAKGKVAAGGLFEQFQEDAIKAAGETGDFVNIAKTLAGPVLGTTHSMQELHDITAMTVNASTAVGESFQQSGMDAMRILQGVAGNEVALWRMLRSMGLIKEDAKEFNQFDPRKRFDLLKKALGDPAFVDAADAFGASWSGLTSSFQDSMKALGRVAGTPVFGFLKTQLAGVNTALQGQVKGGALHSALGMLGVHTTTGLANLRDALKDLFPDATGSAAKFVGAVDRVVTGGLDRIAQGTRWVARHWDGIRAAVERTEAALGRAAAKGEAFVTAVGGGDFAKGAERIGAAALGVKAAQALGVPEMVASGAMAASGAAGTARALGLFGGAAAAAGGAGTTGAAVTGAAAGAAEAAGAGGAAAAVGGVAAGSAVVAAAVALAALGAVAVAAEHDTLGVGKSLEHYVMYAKHGAHDLEEAVGPLWESMKRLWRAVEPLVGVLGGFVYYATPIGWFFHLLAAALPTLEVGLAALARVATSATDSVTDLVRKVEKLVGIKSDPRLPPSDDQGPAPYTNLTELPASNLKNVPTLADAAKELAKTQAQTQKVEVTLKLELGEGNEDAIYIRSGRDFKAAFDRAADNPSTFRLRTT